MTDALLAVSLAWIATYLIHSTVLLGVTWLVTRFSRIGEHAQELMWKFALIGGVATATGQFLGRMHTAPPRVAELRVPIQHVEHGDDADALAQMYRLHGVDIDGMHTPVPARRPTRIRTMMPR